MSHSAIDFTVLYFNFETSVVTFRYLNVQLRSLQVSLFVLPGVDELTDINHSPRFCLRMTESFDLCGRKAKYTNTMLTEASAVVIADIVDVRNRILRDGLAEV